MSEERWLIVGLGNPGKKYENTWHNLGRLAVETLARRHDLSLSKIRFKALCAEGFIKQEPVLLLAPDTYMNRSGESVREASEYYNIPPERMIIIYDDIDLNLGMLRIKEQGSAGSHRGMQSVIYQIESDQMTRIRIGMGPRPRGDMVDIVLSRIPKDEYETVQKSLDAAADVCELILAGDISAAQEHFNHKKEI